MGKIQNSKLFPFSFKINTKIKNVKLIFNLKTFTTKIFKVEYITYLSVPKLTSRRF